MKIEFMGDSLSDVKTQMRDFLAEVDGEGSDNGAATGESEGGTGKKKKPTKEKEVKAPTHDDVRAAFQAISGKGAQKKAILTDFMADSIPELDEADIPKVLVRLKEIE